MDRVISCFGFLSLVVLLCQSGVAAAQSDSADRFKHVAPEKCAAYVMWNAGKASPIEGNRTQALMAEPDVRSFADDLKMRAGLLYPAIISDLSLSKLKTEMVHWLSPRIVEATLDRPGCLFIEELTVPRGRERPISVTGAMLFQPKDDVDRLVKRLVSSLKSDEERPEKVTLAGVEASKVGIENFANPIVVGNFNGTCVIALGEESFSGAVERIKAGKTPAWLSGIENKASKLEDIHTLGYLDMPKILRAAKKGFGANANMVTDLLGVGEASSIELIGGLNKVNSSLHCLINTADSEGVLGLLASQPLDDSIMLQFPKDSLFAGAAHSDFEGALELLDSFVVLMDVGGMGGIRQMVFGPLENELGINIEDDLMESVGDTWGVFNGASDGVLTGTTLVGEATDPEKLTNLLESFFQAAGEKTKEIPARHRPAFFQQTYNQSQIFSMRAPDLVAELALSVKDDRFYVSAFPESIKAAIGDPSLRPVLFEKDQIAQFKQSMFLNESHLAGFAYVDWKGSISNVHPLVLYTEEILQMRYGPLRRNQNLKALLGGIELPPARTLARHLDSSMGFVRAGKSGIEIEIRQTVPTNFAGAMVPAVVGGFLPAAGGARSSAQETRSLNNLRQIALACLNYESAHMRFPGNTSENRNGDEENRFSWRVHILPFIEQNNLYQQIRFEEPWDSEHNKTIAEQMPNIYKSPGSKAEAGMTVYRGFGEGGVLCGDDDEKIGFGNISDGSSNTILVQEVDEALATPWMKPECLEIEEAVLESIFGKHKSRNLAMSDGSTHRIPSTIEVEQFMHLAQRDDGNVVDINFSRNRRWGDLPEPDKRFTKPGLKKQY